MNHNRQGPAPLLAHCRKCTLRGWVWMFGAGAADRSAGASANHGAETPTLAWQPC